MARKSAEVFDRACGRAKTLAHASVWSHLIAYAPGWYRLLAAASSWRELSIADTAENADKSGEFSLRVLRGIRGLKKPPSHAGPVVLNLGRLIAPARPPPWRAFCFRHKDKISSPLGEEGARREALAGTARTIEKVKQRKPVKHVKH